MTDKFQVWDYSAAKERSLGQDKILAEVMSSFMSDSKALIASLQNALLAKDAGQIRFHAHALKGSSANVAAYELSETARALEFAARDNDFGQMTDLYTKLEQAKMSLFTMVQEFLNYLE